VRLAGARRAPWRFWLDNGYWGLESRWRRYRAHPVRFGVERWGRAAIAEFARVRGLRSGNGVRDPTRDARGALAVTAAASRPGVLVDGLGCRALPDFDRLDDVERQLVFLLLVVEVDLAVE